MSGRSLYIKQKVLHLGPREKFSVKDAGENDVYYIKGKVFSLHDTIAIYDLQDNEVASVHKERLSMHTSFKVVVRGKKYATIKKKMLTIGGDKYDITLEKGSLNVSGSIFDHSFKIKDGSSPVGHVKKARLSWGDSYELHIEGNDQEIELLLVGLVVTLDTVDADKED